MTINKGKCEVNFNKGSFLGDQISKYGISPNERLTQKIAEISPPRNKNELKSSLGLNFFYIS